MKQFTYLLINLVVFLPVFLLSFDQKVGFWKKRRAAFAAIGAVAIPFLVWDVWFTAAKYWGFNTSYLGGLSIYNLPLEEILFFLTVPDASLFVFQVVQDYFPNEKIEKIGRPFIVVVGLVIFVGLLFGKGRMYPTLTGGLLFPSLLFAFWKNPRWLGHFALAWILLIIPFLLINGILTGSLIEKEVVWYHADHIIGFRIFTIPIEDLFYGMLLIFWNCFLFEEFKKWKPAKQVDHYKQSYKTHG